MKKTAFVIFSMLTFLTLSNSAYSESCKTRMGSALPLSEKSTRAIANISEMAKVPGGVRLGVCTYLMAGKLDKALNELKSKGYDFTDKVTWHSMKCQPGDEDSTLFEEVSKRGGLYGPTKSLIMKVVRASSKENLRTILNCKDKYGKTVIDFLDLMIQRASDPAVIPSIEKYKKLFIRVGGVSGSKSTEGYCL